MLPVPLVTPPSGIDLKRTNKLVVIRGEKFRAQPWFELKKLFESPIRILSQSVKFRTQRLEMTITAIAELCVSRRFCFFQLRRQS